MNIRFSLTIMGGGGGGGTTKYKNAYFLFFVYKLSNSHRLFAVLNGETLKLSPQDGSFDIKCKGSDIGSCRNVMLI